MKLIYSPATSLWACDISADQILNKWLAMILPLIQAWNMKTGSGGGTGEK